ncbi:MAG: DUF4332 domain-containing protein [Verrucomicrobia bacterium]|jgi:hypothetical protein|nr:DUF4332 domain-containing protein [Verrucomicrobiota bacterium]
MIRIGRIDGIDEDSLALLEAAGFQNVASLARIGPIVLHRELTRANELLRITSSVPETAQLRQWIDAAREIYGINDAASDDAETEEGVEKLTVQELLEAAPVAVPLPIRMLVENKIGVADVPSAMSLDEVACYLDKARMVEGMSGKSSGDNVRLAESGGARVQIDISRLRSIEEFADPSATPVVASENEVDRIALIRSPRKESNEGRDPNSRRYLRGILHKSPVSIYFGALVTLTMMLTIPLAVVSAFLLLASTHLPKFFSWVPSWLLAFPLILPLIALFYAVYGNICSCRVCCQKLFVPKSHLKSPRAHHVKLLGYILPLCVHIILFRWFRCTHCGTPIRLKE